MTAGSPVTATWDMPIYVDEALQVLQQWRSKEHPSHCVRQVAISPIQEMDVFHGFVVFTLSYYRQYDRDLCMAVLLLMRSSLTTRYPIASHLMMAGPRDFGPEQCQLHLVKDDGLTPYSFVRKSLEEIDLSADELHRFAELLRWLQEEVF